MAEIKDKIALGRVLMANPRLLRLRPAVTIFLLRYINKFKLKRVGGQLFVHSHLPALNSKAYTRFVDIHLLNRASGPSHAQISVTNRCPQSCACCYNKDRQGQLLTTAEIKATAQSLKRMGVVWLGLTGGEPLLQPNLTEIVASVGDDCAVKLFTTGWGLTEKMAADLKAAGLSSVSVSLDHWDEKIHDNVRGCPGAYRSALRAIDIFIRAGLHVSVSAVISRQMIQERQVAGFVDFMAGLGAHEAWLSETKPVLAPFWEEAAVITEDEMLSLVRLQDRYNQRQGITVNYLGHFEGREHFGCNAGRKMVYIDAFGEVSPCVFIPVSFGNVREQALADIYHQMQGQFPPAGCCFINRNYPLLKKYFRDQYPFCKEDTLALMENVMPGPPAEFHRRQAGGKLRRER